MCLGGANRAHNLPSLLAGQLQTPVPSTPRLSPAFEKSLCGHCCGWEPLSRSPTLYPSSPSFWYSRNHPHPPALSLLVTTVPAWVLCQPCACSLSLPGTSHTEVAPGTGLRFLTLGGEGAARLLSLTQLSSSTVPVAAVAAVVSGAMPGDFPRQPVKHPYRPFCSILCCTCRLPHLVSGKTLFTSFT